jgi:membrane protease YdiL (CAAX protease family)
MGVAMVARTALGRSHAARIGDRFASVNAQPASADPYEWCKLLGGLAIVFALFQGLAHALGSDRGQAGVLVAAAAIAALVAAQGLLFGQSFRAALHSLGFVRPAGRGVIVAVGLSLLLLAVLSIYAAIRGASLAAYPGWLWLLPGLFAQGGIAEEALFRGYLFGHLRRGRSFWHAAGLATLPFALAHLYLLAVLPWPVAIASVLLSTILAVPLARLFELGGNTIWPPALLHFTVQGAVKILEVPGDTVMPLVWISASALISYLAFYFNGAQR